MPNPTRLTYRPNRPELVLVSGMGNPELTEQVAYELNVSVTPTVNKQYTSGELGIELGRNARKTYAGKDVYILAAADNEPSNQALTAWGPNSAITEVQGMAYALKQAGAHSVVAGFPAFPYAQSDEQGTNHKAVMAAVLCNTLQANGVDRLFTLDVHAEPVQGFFDAGKIENIDPLTTLLPGMERWARSKPLQDLVVLAPRANAFERASRVAQTLSGVLRQDLTMDDAAFCDAPDTALGEPIRIPHSLIDIDKHGNVQSNVSVGNVDLAGRDVLIIDDLIKNGDVAKAALRTLTTIGARSALVAATHGYLHGDTTREIAAFGIADGVLVTNSVYQGRHQLADQPDFLRVQTAAPAIAQKIMQMYAPNGG